MEYKKCKICNYKHSRPEVFLEIENGITKGVMMSSLIKSINQRFALSVSPSNVSRHKRHMGLAKRNVHVKRENPDVEAQIGYVYIVKAGGFCKIGSSCDIKKRIEHIATSSPIPVELLKSVKVVNCSTNEAILQKIFKHKKEKGEWFILSGGDIEIATNYLSIYEVIPFD